MGKRSVRTGAVKASKVFSYSELSASAQEVARHNYIMSGDVDDVAFDAVSGYRDDFDKLLEKIGAELVVFDTPAMSEGRRSFLFIEAQFTDSFDESIPPTQYELSGNGSPIIDGFAMTWNSCLPNLQRDWERCADSDPVAVGEYIHVFMRALNGTLQFFAPEIQDEYDAYFDDSPNGMVADLLDGIDNDILFDETGRIAQSKDASVHMADVSYDSFSVRKVLKTCYADGDESSIIEIVAFCIIDAWLAWSGSNNPTFADESRIGGVLADAIMEELADGKDVTDQVYDRADVEAQRLYDEAFNEAKEAWDSVMNSIPRRFASRPNRHNELEEYLRKNRFVTSQDAIDYYIAPALGGYSGDYDLDGIFDAAFEYVDGAYQPIEAIAEESLDGIDDTWLDIVMSNELVTTASRHANKRRFVSKQQVWRCDEDGCKGTFSLDELRDIYDREIEHDDDAPDGAGFSHFEDWLHEMERMGVYVREGRRSRKTSTRKVAQETYTIVKSRDGHNDIEQTGTLQELIEKYRYTLEKGRAYQNERGNSRINMNPNTVEELVEALNAAVNNAAANGCSETSFRTASVTHHMSAHKMRHKNARKKASAYRRIKASASSHVDEIIDVFKSDAPYADEDEARAALDDCIDNELIYSDDVFDIARDYVKDQTLIDMFIEEFTDDVYSAIDDLSAYVKQDEEAARHRSSSRGTHRHISKRDIKNTAREALRSASKRRRASKKIAQGYDEDDDNRNFLGQLRDDLEEAGYNVVTFEEKGVLTNSLGLIIDGRQFEWLGSF